MGVTGADAIVEALTEAGVSVVFGLPGVHNLALWEALRESAIRLVGVRHEQAAAYAADGYFRATGRVGVALTTTGPGAANTLGAVGEAYASRSGILVIATEVATAHRGLSVLHGGADQAAMFAPVTAASFFGIEGAGSALAAAAESSRPVYLEVPTDQLRQSGTARSKSSPSGTGKRYQEDAVSGGRYQGDAVRPLVWVEDAWKRDEVVELAERLGAPVIEAYSGRGAMPLDHPLRVGFPPHLPSVGALWDQANTVIAVGARFDGMNTQNFAMPQPPQLIAIGETGPSYRPDLTLLHCHDVPGEGEPWADLNTVRSEACQALDPRAMRFLDAIEYGLPPEANVVCDMCIPGYWIGGFHPFPEPRKLLYPVGWGTLGFGFPAAIGAALADTGPTVAICGDGGFLFACGELATIAQEDVPLTTVIVDDGGYGMLRFDQDQAGEPRFGVDLRTPDFEQLAASFGIIADTVEGLEDAFGEALARHVGDPTPSVLVAKAEALTPPPTTSPQWYRRTR